MVWQGVLRYFAQESSYQKFTVCCPTGCEYLYRDFATDFKIYDPPKETNMWMAEKWHFDYRKLPPYDIVVQPQNCLKRKQTFIKYGTKGKHLYDIVIHARSTDKCESDYRNWPATNWEKLLALFPDAKVVSIGSVVGASHIRGTDDKRGISLAELADILANSTVLVGPSSGPMHFGSLCGIPHVTWSPKETTAIMSNKDRYEKNWNVFDTPVTFLEGTWQPDVDKVAGAVRKYYDN